MRNHFLRAAAGAAVPIEFVGAAANTSNDTPFQTANVAVEDGDVAIFFSTGTLIYTDPVSSNTTSGSSILFVYSGSNSDIVEIANTGYEVDTDNVYLGEGPNDLLFGRIEVVRFTASGNVYVKTDSTEFQCGAGVIVLRGGDSAEFDAAKATPSGSDTISLTSGGTVAGEAMVHLVVSQDVGSYPSGDQQTIPSGFTNTGEDISFEVGAGGGRESWYARSSYFEGQKLLSPMHSFSTTSDEYASGIIFRIYNA